MSSVDPGRRRYFLVDWLPPLLHELARAAPPRTLADLGAADGSVIYGLERAGLAAETVYAVDLSPERVAFCTRLAPNVRGIVADATAVGELPDASVDAVVASQLIEHLPDDRALPPEIARILRPGGWFYVSSVVRGPRAWWVYRRDGHPVADPTHLREYRSEDEFAAAIAHPDLAVERLRSEPLRFPLTDMAVRAVALAGAIPYRSLPDLYRGRPLLARTRRLRMRVPGYRWVEAAGRRR